VSATAVSALPFALLDLSARTAEPDGDVRRLASALDAALGRAGGAAGLGAAVVGHVTRSEALAAAAAATGLAMLLAGGAAGALALGVRAAGPPAPADAADLLALALGSGGVPLLPAPTVDPSVVRALAAAIGADVLGAVAASHPELVGPVDGMPVALRYEANRRIAERAGLHDLAAPERRLLLVDPDGGRVVEVFGDLRAADAVAVVVPGMGNDLAGFAAVRAKAEALRAAAASLHPPADLVTIAWLGYDSPQHVGAYVDDAAVDGGRALAAFAAGLTAGGLPAGARRTVVGHSYGSVVAGRALREGLDVDAVAVTGSPGMGARSAGALGDTPIFALATVDDLVSSTEHFGTDPTDPDFGATALATGDARGHASYFEPCGEALRNLALVAVGRVAEARPAATSTFARAVEVIDDVEGVPALPVDLLQAGAARAAAALSDGAEVLEGVLPPPAAGAVDLGQDAAGLVLEVADRAVDDGQRLLSPSFALDTLEDAWSLLDG
jgi:hypothetical protein